MTRATGIRSCRPMRRCCWVRMRWAARLRSDRPGKRERRFPRRSNVLRTSTTSVFDGKQGHAWKGVSSWPAPRARPCRRPQPIGVCPERDAIASDMTQLPAVFLIQQPAQYKWYCNVGTAVRRHADLRRASGRQQQGALAPRSALPLVARRSAARISGEPAGFGGSANNGRETWRLSTDQDEAASDTGAAGRDLADFGGAGHAHGDRHHLARPTAAESPEPFGDEHLPGQTPRRQPSTILPLESSKPKVDQDPRREALPGETWGEQVLRLP